MEEKIEEKKETLEKPEKKRGIFTVKKAFVIAAIIILAGTVYV